MDQRTCSLDGCMEAVSAKDMCKRHYASDLYQRTKDERSQKARARYLANAEEIKAKARAAYQADPEGKQAQVRAWKLRNPDYQHVYDTRRYAENRAELQVTARAYYLANRETAIQRAREWAEANPEKRREIRARYKKSERGRLVDLANVHARLARKRGASGRATPEQLTARWNYYGGRCWMCWGPADQWDHVIPLSGGGTNWPSNLRPACRCNQKKGAKIMAITAASFVPDKRAAGGGGGGPGGANGGGSGPSVGHAATVHGGIDTSYNEATTSATMASHETTPATHPITGTALPKGTGAGKGSIHRGGRGGK